MRPEDSDEMKSPWFWVALAIIVGLLALILCGCASEALRREAWHVKRDTALVASRDDSPEAQRAAIGAKAILDWSGMPKSEPEISDFELDTKCLVEEAQTRSGLLSGVVGLFDGLSGSGGLLGGIAGLVVAAWQFYNATKRKKMLEAVIGGVEAADAPQAKTAIKEQMVSAGLEPAFHKLVQQVTK